MINTMTYETDHEEMVNQSEATEGGKKKQQKMFLFREISPVFM